MSKKNRRNKEEKSPQDTSPHIPQNPKLKQELAIRNIEFTENQQKAVNCILNKESKIIFLSGPAGSGKSLLTTYCGLKLLSEKRISDLVFVRSPLESSDSAGLGFLKGDLSQKFEPYCQILQEKMHELLTVPQIKTLQEQHKIISIPVNYTRGIGWTVKYIQIEESNNFTFSEYKLLLTRYGFKSKMIFVGDFGQTDLPEKKRGAFQKMFDLFDNEESRLKGIFCHTLTKVDIKRSDILGYILEKLENPPRETMFSD